MLCGCITEVVTNQRRVLDNGLIFLLFRIQNTHRVFLKSFAGKLTHGIEMRLQVGFQNVFVGFTTGQIPDRVDFQAGIGDSDGFVEMHHETDHLGICNWICTADHLDAKLMKLTLPPFLRSFRTKHRPDVI